MSEKQNSPVQAGKQMEDEISLKELFLKLKAIWQFILSKWKVILVSAAIGGVVGLAYSIFKKTSYTATVSFVLEEQKSGSGLLGSYAGIASQFGINLGGMDGQGLFTGDNIMEFLKSRRMIQKTLLTTVEIEGKKELLVDRYSRFTKLRKSWNEDPKLADFSFIPDTTGIFLQDSILGDIYKTLLKKNLTIEKPDKKLNIIAVEVESTDELFSKAFAEQLIKNVSADYIRSRTKNSAENVAVLTKMVDSVRQELNSAIGGVANASDANPNANRAFQSLRVPSQKRTVDVQANTAIFSELVKQQELARMTLRNEKPLIQILDRPILPLEKSKVGKIKGILIGGILFGFFAVLFLLGKSFISEVMNEEGK